MHWKMQDRFQSVQLWLHEEIDNEFETNWKESGENTFKWYKKVYDCLKMYVKCVW